jgi:chaperonin GroEL
MNGGFEGSLVVQNVLEGEGDYGFNARTDTYGHLLEEGVIDPTKVTRSALENAASIGGLLLTTESIVARIPSKKDNAGGMSDYDMDF